MSIASINNFASYSDLLTNHPVLAQNLQANIIVDHGRRYSWQLFLQFSGDMQAVKDWIGQLDITSTHKLVSDILQRRTSQANAANNPAIALHDGGLVTCFYLSATGYDKLGYPKEAFADDPFKSGLKNSRKVLKDPPADEWQHELQPTMDAMLLIADASYDTVNAQAKAIAAALPAAVALLHVQKGEKLYNEHQLGIEHNGYVDGISQPLFFAEEENPVRKQWSDLSPLDIVLVPDPHAPKEAIDTFGSYLVYRKLEQNVKAFKETEEALGEVIFPAEEQEDEREIIGAYAVGRFEDATVVTKNSSELHIKKDTDLDNDFDYRYDKAANRCPYHAHIRVTNPRGDVANPERLRITRRGIPYDEAGRNNNLKWFPTQDVGLLFMCFQSSIEKQFEAMQIRANGTTGKPIDPIIGQGTNNAKQPWPYRWDDSTRLTGQNLSNFVTMKGGEYFFAPSIPFLKNL
jgi:Dyp-type peroxidase family